MEGQLKDLLAR